ncbi:MAG: YfhO family protein [Deltaproteobacteria bacterium]|nr:YfhO family protein [Deltaproteobacteria bacterium]
MSAIVFTFNGYVLGHLYAGHLSLIQVYIWIPLLFLFAHRFLEFREIRYAILAGLVLGVQILGGFPQVSFYTILAFVLFACYSVLAPRREHVPGTRVKMVLGCGLVLVVGFALAAIQILPTYEFARLSTRAGGVSYSFATYDSLHPKELLAFLVPYIFGSPVDGNYWRSQEPWHFWETCGYVGIVPIFLVFVAAQRDRMRHARFFFLGLIVFSLFLALGKHNPLYPLFYRLPGFNSFRIPAQIIFLYVFGMGILSGIALDQVSTGEWRLGQKARSFFVALGVLLALLFIAITLSRYSTFYYLFKFFAKEPIEDGQLLGLYERVRDSVYQSGFLFFCTALLFWALKRGRIPHRMFTGLICLILAGDLLFFGSGFVHTWTFRSSPKKEEILSALSKDPVKGRVVTASTLFQVNDGLRYSFPSILGYDPLILKRYVEYILFAQGENTDQPEGIVNLSRIRDPRAKLIRLLNTRYLIDEKKIRVLDNGVPYVALVNRAVFMPSDKILSFMGSEEFEPTCMVVLEGKEGQGMRTEGKEVRGKGGGTFSVLEYENDAIRIQVKTPMPAYMVLSEIYYPGWRARVNGKRAEILRGNYLFRVIPLEAGEHEVRLSFVSWPFRIGAVLSLITVLLSLYLLLRRRNL